MAYVIPEELTCLEDMDIETRDSIALQDAYEKIDVLKDFDGLEIELRGTWVWIHGKTKENKENLKMQGCRWKPTEPEWWSWHSPLIDAWKRAHGIGKNHRKAASTTSIRTKYGVQRTVVGTDPRED